jgi:hypothetical protein
MRPDSRFERLADQLFQGTTRTSPIVFVGVVDQIGSGFATPIRVLRPFNIRSIPEKAVPAAL